jgi:hypothetical protein
MRYGTEDVCALNKKRDVWRDSSNGSSVKTAFDPLHAEEERTLDGHNRGVLCLKIIWRQVDQRLLYDSRSYDKTINAWSTDTWTPGHASVPSKAIPLVCSPWWYMATS